MHWLIVNHTERRRRRRWRSLAARRLLGARRRRGRIAGRRRRVILARWRAEQLRQDRLQRIRPHLIPLDGRVEPVARHSVEQLPSRIGEGAVDVQIPNRPAVGEAGDPAIGFVDHRHGAHRVVAGKNGGQDDRRLWRLAAHDVEDRPDPAADVLRPVRDVDRLRDNADVVGARQEHDDLRVHGVQLTVVQPPQHVLRRVAAPAEVGGVPADQLLPPVAEQVRVVGGSPAPGDRVAGEIDIDATAPRLLDQLRVCRDGVLVRASHRDVGGRRRWPLRELREVGQALVAPRGRVDRLLSQPGGHGGVALAVHRVLKRGPRRLHLRGLRGTRRVVRDEPLPEGLPRRQPVVPRQMVEPQQQRSRAWSSDRSTDRRSA